jgi:hypothetical protein
LFDRFTHRAGEVVSAPRIAATEVNVAVGEFSEIEDRKRALANLPEVDCNHALFRFVFFPAFIQAVPIKNGDRETIAADSIAMVVGFDEFDFHGSKADALEQGDDFGLGAIGGVVPNYGASYFRANIINGLVPFTARLDAVIHGPQQTPLAGFL